MRPAQFLLHFIEYQCLGARVCKCLFIMKFSMEVFLIGNYALFDVDTTLMKTLGPSMIIVGSWFQYKEDMISDALRQTSVLAKEAGGITQHPLGGPDKGLKQKKSQKQKDESTFVSFVLDLPNYSSPHCWYQQCFVTHDIDKEMALMMVRT
ncbi:hypothetical protein WN944_027655 [Citrus x changshan-huyou]|uniref:Uncharacterized protein n=1 Tax=Citrus x changshan-huyou TaxID=2935761 RepID=A0AAP0LJ11_9ROSI